MMKISLILASLYFLKIIISPNKNKISPWPISPNITPNKNGKVTVVNSEGLAYRYLAIPYVSTTSCADRVKEFRSKRVGFFVLRPGASSSIGIMCTKGLRVIFSNSFILTLSC